MSEALRDKRLGLVLKGYDLVPNAALETVIAVYTAEVVQTILYENPGIMDGWLQKLDKEYAEKKKSCELDNDPLACYTVSFYEQFEKHFKSWQDGGIIAIKLPRNRIINLSKRPLFSVAVADDKPSRHVCEKCLAVFADIKELEKHYQEGHAQSQTEKTKGYVIKTESDIDGYYAKNPIWR